MTMHVLIIDDDPSLLAALYPHLTAMGYLVDHAGDGEEGLRKALTNLYSLIIVDLVMPGLNGFEVCQKLRYSRSNVPLLVLSAQEDVIDRVISLELGADDFLRKPFDIRELTARIEALLRRSRTKHEIISSEASQISVGEIHIDRIRKKVFRGNELILLSVTEYRLLETLAVQPGRTFSREELRKSVWGFSASSFDHTITTTVSRLRTKIERDPRHPKYVLSERGQGYRFAESHELG